MKMPEDATRRAHKPQHHAPPKRMVDEQFCLLNYPSALPAVITAPTTTYWNDLV